MNKTLSFPAYYTVEEWDGSEEVVLLKNATQQNTNVVYCNPFTGKGEDYMTMPSIHFCEIAKKCHGCCLITSAY